MRLILTAASPSDATYTDTSGAPKYKVHTRGWTTSISRALEEAEIPRRQSRSSSLQRSVDIDKEQVRFASLAQIEWRLAKTSVLRLGEHELEASSFFRKEGWGWYGR
jgi:hypothetical protein